MLGVTHQMLALLAAFWLLIQYPISLGPVLGIFAVIAVMIGALTPDLDQPTANLWRRMLGGRAIGNIFQVFSGGHRHMTHSFIGIIAIALFLQWFIRNIIHPDYFVQSQALWLAFMVGYISHPIADTLTDRGVPWFWPFQVQIKFPPGPEELRVTTGSFVEMVLVRGGILIAAALLLIRNWQILTHLFWK